MPAVVIDALTPDASTREYFRVRWNNQSAIACVYPTDEAGRAQFEACLDVTELFLGAGLPVAKVIFEDSGHLVIIHQDFGDSILRDRLEAADPETREMYLDDAIRIIARIQAATGLAFERNSVASRLRFDFEKLAWEFSFFTEHYFRSLTGRDPESIPAEFKIELDAVADELACSEQHEDSRRQSGDPRNVTCLHPEFPPKPAVPAVDMAVLSRWSALRPLGCPKELRVDAGIVHVGQ